jgi:hypothetical protein
MPQSGRFGRALVGREDLFVSIAENSSTRKSLWAVPLHYLLLGAVGLILASVVIDLSKELHELQHTKDQIINDIVGFRLFSLNTITGLLRELGFACAIAWAIAISIERVARDRDERHVSETRQLIAQDVFRAVIGSFVPKDIRDITFDTILLAPITRSRMRLDISVKPLNPKYQELGRQFIGIQYEIDYEVSNESSSASPFNVDLYVDKCPCSALASENKIDTIKIGDENALTPGGIEKGKILTETESELRYRWPRSIPGRGRLRVFMRWSSIKGIYDSVVWTTLLPTMNFEVRFDNGIRDLTWAIDPLHHGALAPIEARRDYGLNQYQAAKPLLPYQGVQVSWRPVESPMPVPADGPGVVAVPAVGK